MNLRLALFLAPALVAGLAAPLAAPLAAAPAAIHGLALPGHLAVPAQAFPWIADPIEEVERRGRSRPRAPRGSGCDDPRDILEHPACRR